MIKDSLKIPVDYAPGYERARRIDPELAHNYIAHTQVGDPLADALVETLSGLSRTEGYRFIEGGMNQNAAVLGNAPLAVQEFFETVEQQPDWVSREDFASGILSFHRESDLILLALVGGSLIEGFSSNIARSFDITGRLRDQGIRRLEQNNRHVVEIFLPGGLERYGDGWKLSVRIRIVHAQVRRLMNRTEEWDLKAWGIPLSAAHMALASAAFSGRLLRHAERLGVPFSHEERESFMHIWRYTMHLMGVPSTILWRDEREALKLFEVASACEPPPGVDSIIMAHELIEAAPLLLGVEDGKRKEAILKLAFSVSRALIGRELADLLKFPKYRTWGLLEEVWLRTKFDLIKSKMLQGRGRTNRFSHFKYLMNASIYDKGGISFRLPDHVHSEESHRWWKAAAHRYWLKSPSPAEGDCIFVLRR